ncbi:MAG: hypothetical protein H7Z14_13060 [Anaerolineae bacterium]|nr:hypothetical protein [Phycisphaerae bacterium]
MYVDMRGVLAARVLTFCGAPDVRRWLEQKKRSLLEETISEFDRGLVRRTFNPSVPEEKPVALKVAKSKRGRAGLGR